MQIADAPRTATSPPRDLVTRERQLESALAGHEAVFADLAAHRHVVWLGFHVGAFNLAVDTPPADLGQPGGEQTRLNRSLEQALQQAAARPLSGVVVLSDGRTSDPPSRALVRRLQADAVPVFVVPLGADEPIGDLALRRIEAPRRAFIRDKVPVIVEFDRLGGADDGGQVAVSLVDQLSGEVLDRVEVDDLQDENRVTLTAQPSLVGEAQWEVLVESDRPDLVPDNNAKPVVIELVDRPLRVLYVDGYPRWEYRYLKNLLVREKSIDSSVMLLSADRDFAQEGNQPITRLPRSPEEFAQFDVIVIGDVPGTFFSFDQLEAIRMQVAERGTGLLWIAGEQSTPRTYGGTTLADLLPMRGSLALTPIEQPVNMRPTPLADRLGVLRLSLDDRTGWPEELLDPAYGWSSLYWAQRIEPGRLKPTAEVLAETTADFDGGPLPLAIHMRYGAGQTIYIATDEVWRWRFGRGEQLTEQFWIQMIRMLGRESLIGSGERAALEVTPRRVTLHQPVHVDLRLLDEQVTDTRRAGVAAKVVNAEGATVAELELRRTGTDEEHYGTTWVPSVTGELRVRLDDPTVQGLDVEAAVEVFAAEDEMRHPQTDHDLLEDLADATGGRVLAPDDLDELTTLLPNRSVRTINPLRERIWDSPLFFAVIVLLITVEWIGRKAMRLA